MNRHRHHTLAQMKPILLCSLIVLLGEASVFAQVIQLPSIRNFSYRGSVLVPDQGTASLGGVSRYTEGSTRRGFGPLSQRGSGRSLSTSNASVSVTIIDHQEIDRQLLGQSGITQDIQAKRTKKLGSVNEVKSLVHNARSALSRGQRRQAQGMYELAIEMLERLSKVENATGSMATKSHSDPRYLLVWARREYAEQFPRVISESKRSVQPIRSQDQTP